MRERMEREGKGVRGQGVMMSWMIEMSYLKVEAYGASA